MVRYANHKSPKKGEKTGGSMTDEIEIQLTPEEEAEEKEATAEVADDDLRSKVAEGLGLNPEDDKDKVILDKAVEREKASRKMTSKAIQQKISLREKLKASAKPKTEQKDKPDFDTAVSQKVREEFENRDLEALDLPDELKTEVKDFAKMKGLSVREAAKSEYITFKKEKFAREERARASAPNRSGTNKGSSTANIDYSKPINPANYDMNSVEGRKAYAEDRKASMSYRAKNT